MGHVTHNTNMMDSPATPTFLRWSTTIRRTHPLWLDTRMHQLIFVGGIYHPWSGYALYCPGRFRELQRPYQQPNTSKGLTQHQTLLHAHTETETGRGGVLRVWPSHAVWRRCAGVCRARLFGGQDAAQVSRQPAAAAAVVVARPFAVVVWHIKYLGVGAQVPQLPDVLVAWVAQLNLPGRG